MEHEEIKNLIIKKGGFLTIEQIKTAFTGENEEVLEMKLDFLVNKNRIRKAQYQSDNGHSLLYYIPRQ